MEALMVNRAFFCVKSDVELVLKKSFFNDKSP
jgi:hypothetical protein